MDVVLLLPQYWNSSIGVAVFDIVVVFDVAEFDIMVIDVSAFIVAVFDILHMALFSGKV